MIIIKLKGGLGNQMFQYALGRRLALDREVPLKFDLSWFHTQNKRGYELDCFNIAADIASHDEVMKVTLSNWRWLSERILRSVQRQLPYYRRRTIKEKKRGFDPKILGTRSNVYLIGYWSSELYFKDIASTIRKDFQLREPLSNEFHRWAEVIRVSNSISIHVRRGDYISDQQVNRVHRVCSLDYYLDAVQCIQEQLPDINYYIFSDDIEWAEKNLTFLSPAAFIKLHSPERDAEELNLISLCKHHIIANSTYSWWGAWLNPSPQKIVIAPGKWFNDPDREISDLIPESWVRV